MNCMQGCGHPAPASRRFCSDRCRHLYNAHTWGEGDGPEVIEKLTRLGLRKLKGPTEIYEVDQVLLHRRTK